MENEKNQSPTLGAELLGLLRPVRRFFGKIFQNSKSAAGLIIVLFFIFLAVFGPMIFPYDTQINMDNILQPISKEHWLGTDDFGLDIFRQLLSGAGDVLSIAFLAGVITVVVGTLLGMISGFLGGVVDKLIQGLANIVLTIPSFPIIMVMASIFTISDPFLFAVVLSAWSWAGLCRAIRAQIMSLKERDFVQICKVMNMGWVHIIFMELMPNIASYIIINFIMSVRNAITGSVGIMTLGLAKFDISNWGVMLYRAREHGLIDTGIYPLLFAPLICIIVFQAGTMLLANGLDEVLNPRLKVK